MKKPSFLMVLTAVGQYAYKRPKDGVLVVPIEGLIVNKGIVTIMARYR